jgi:hypothetical protein
VLAKNSVIASEANFDILVLTSEILRYRRKQRLIKFCYAGELRVKPQLGKRGTSQDVPRTDGTKSYWTWVVAMAELLFLLGSEPDPPTLAVSVIVLPDPAVTLTTIEIFTFAPLGWLLMVHITVPVPPCCGPVQVPALVLTL